MARVGRGRLLSTTVSHVSPEPNPSNTPHSGPSPVVVVPLDTDIQRTWSRMKSTHALDMLPY